MLEREKQTGNLAPLLLLLLLLLTTSALVARSFNQVDSLEGGFGGGGGGGGVGGFVGLAVNSQLTTFVSECCLAPDCGSMEGESEDVGPPGLSGGRPNSATTQIRPLLR